MSLLAGAEDRELVAGAVPDGLTIAFGDHRTAGGYGMLVRFTDATTAADVAKQADELTVATSGEGLWRRAPWPAADELFSVPAAVDGAAVLVVHGDEGRRVEHAAKLAAHGLSTSNAPRLRRADLMNASTVIFLDEGSFPALAPAACAAARLVIVQRPEPLFGLQDGVDCFVADDDRSVVIAQTAGQAPRAFDALRSLARLAVRSQRASAVYERLALDLSLGVGRERRGQRPGA
jgi:hypothetical protein